MESADDARWCDFCKEPFRALKKEAPPAAAPAPVAVPAPAAAPASEPKLSEEELLKRLPQEFLRGDDGQKLPALPPWFKWLAWAFLASWLIAGMVLAGVLYGKKKVAEPLPDIPPQPTYDSGPIVVPDPK
jgi:hypothetical protein